MATCPDQPHDCCIVSHRPRCQAAACYGRYPACCEGCTAGSHREPAHCTVCWPVDEPSPRVVDLMAALEASLAAVKQRQQP
jgi:hypothetical protein